MPMPKMPFPEPPFPLPPFGQELNLFQYALERLLAPELGGLRGQTREIVDWILEAYLSLTPQEKTLAYAAARHAAQETSARLAADEAAGTPLSSERRAQLRKDLAYLETELDRVVDLLGSQK